MSLSLNENVSPKLLQDCLILYFFPRLPRSMSLEATWLPHHTRLMKHYELNIDHTMCFQDAQIQEFLQQSPLRLHFYSYAEQAFQKINNDPGLQSSQVLRECFDIGNSSQLVSTFLSKRISLDEQYSSKFCDDRLEVLFISQKK